MIRCKFSNYLGRGAAGVILLASVFQCACQKPGAGAPAVYGDKPIFQFSDEDLNAYLADLHAREPDVRRRVVEIGRRTIGQPYKLGPLGEGGLESYDPDPLYCLTASDCVTFVEQTWAMALSRDKPEFLDTLRRIRYRDGKIGMLTRNHFTEADWNVNNEWLFVEANLGVTWKEKLRYTLSINRKAFFAKFGLTLDEATAMRNDKWWDNTLFPETGAPTTRATTDVWIVNESGFGARDVYAKTTAWEVQRWADHYIPVSKMENGLPNVRDADVIEFVKNKESPFVGHMGLITHDANGTVMLLHSGEPAVQELPLMDYLRRHPNIAGVKVLRVRADGSHMTQE